MNYTNEELMLFLNDIKNGYSKSQFLNNKIYIKHPDLNLEFTCNAYYSELIQKYKEMGVPSELDRIQLLKETGDWTEKDELELTQNKILLNGLNNTKNKIFLDSQKNKILEEIESISNKIEKSSLKRSELVGATIEKYASIKKEEFYISNSIFLDKNLNSKLFGNDNFDELDFYDLDLLIKKYYKEMINFKDILLKKISTLPIFYNYFSIYSLNESYKIFSEKVWDLTFFQQKIVTYSNNIKYIYENTSDLPENKNLEYDELIAFVNQKNKKNNAKENKNFSPFETLKKSGKESLNKKDFLNVFDQV